MHSTLCSSCVLMREVQAHITPDSSGTLTNTFRQIMLGYAEVQGVYGQFNVRLRGSLVSAHTFKLDL
jgi:hypothetical protein